MDLKNYKSQIGGSIFVVAALSYILSSGLLVNGSSATMKDLEFSKHEGTVTTIEVTEDGDVVDCVDIYKQPAFNHPLLKDHTIQMTPSSFPKETAKQDPKINAFQSWLNILYCPEGTVPIVRTKISEHHRPSSFIGKENHQNASVKYAQVRMSPGIYLGAEAIINIWNPKTADGDYSAAQIWLVSGEMLSDRNVIQAGWTVQTPDKTTRFSVGWTKDGYQKTGCYNFKCPGFVLTSRAIFIGAPVHPISEYGGKQYEVKISIKKDMVTGNWWLQMMDQVLGYWPGVIFTGLSKSSQFIYWGGEVGTDENLTKTTEMGSGHFPSEGLGRASFFRSLGFVNNGGFMQVPDILFQHVINPSWYKVLIPVQSIKAFGRYFFFGGPGHHSSKQNKVAE